jgi:hypothetical protein
MQKLGLKLSFLFVILIISHISSADQAPIFQKVNFEGHVDPSKYLACPNFIQKDPSGGLSFDELGTIVNWYFDDANPEHNSKESLWINGFSDFKYICPNYTYYDATDRVIVWNVLLSNMAFRESTCNSNAFLKKSPDGSGAYGPYQQPNPMKIGIEKSTYRECSKKDSAYADSATYCALDMLAFQQKSSPLFSNNSYWDVLRLTYVNSSKMRNSIHGLCNDIEKNSNSARYIQEAKKLYVEKKKRVEQELMDQRNRLQGNPPRQEIRLELDTEIHTFPASVIKKMKAKDASYLATRIVKKKTPIPKTQGLGKAPAVSTLVLHQPKGRIPKPVDPPKTFQMETVPPKVSSKKQTRSIQKTTLHKTKIKSSPKRKTSKHRTKTSH